MQEEGTKDVRDGEESNHLKEEDVSEQDVCRGRQRCGGGGVKQGRNVNDQKTETGEFGGGGLKSRR